MLPAPERCAAFSPVRLLSVERRAESATGVGVHGEGPVAGVRHSREGLEEIAMERCRDDDVEDVEDGGRKPPADPTGFAQPA